MWVKLSEYMDAAFPPELLHEDEMPLLAHPASYVDADGQHDYYKQYGATPRRLDDADTREESWLTCVSTVERTRGKARRRYKDIKRAFILPLDDIMTKAEVPPVEPSCILETSPGNFQYHYFLEPYDVSTAKGQVYYDACLICAADAGYSDPGMRAATRVCKLPGAIHKTGFVTAVHRWEPDAVWQLEDLMAAMGVRVRRVKQPRGAPRPGKHNVLDTVIDPLYHWLVAHWPVYGNNSEWVHIECPWRATHTDGAQGSSSSSYSPDDYGLVGRGFKCRHGHCAHRGTAEFLNTMRQLGARI